MCQIYYRLSLLHHEHQQSALQIQNRGESRRKTTALLSSAPHAAAANFAPATGYSLSLLARDRNQLSESSSVSLIICS